MNRALRAAAVAVILILGLSACAAPIERRAASGAEESASSTAATVCEQRTAYDDFQVTLVNRTRGELSIRSSAIDCNRPPFIPVELFGHEFFPNSQWSGASNPSLWNGTVLAAGASAPAQTIATTSVCGGIIKKTTYARPIDWDFQFSYVLNGKTYAAVLPMTISCAGSTNFDRLGTMCLSGADSEAHSLQLKDPATGAEVFGELIATISCGSNGHTVKVVLSQLY